jgi:hypothetical protein
MDKDPWCCASDKMQISLDGFDAGCLTTYRSLRHVVLRLTREEALEIIDHMIEDIERGRDARQGNKR